MSSRLIISSYYYIYRIALLSFYLICLSKSIISPYVYVYVVSGSRDYSLSPSIFNLYYSMSTGQPRCPCPLAYERHRRMCSPGCLKPVPRRYVYGGRLAGAQSFRRGPTKALACLPEYPRSRTPSPLSKNHMWLHRISIADTCFPGRQKEAPLLSRCAAPNTAVFMFLLHLANFRAAPEFTILLRIPE